MTTNNQNDKKQSNIQSRRGFLKLTGAGAVITTTGLAGCSGGSDGGDGGGGDGGDGGDGDDGGGDGGPTGGNSLTHDIGINIPGSGKFSETASFYRASFEGWEMWIDDEFDFSVNVEYADNESKETRSSKVASQFVSDEKDFIINTYSSSLTKASIPPVEQAGVPMMSTGSKNPSIHRPNDWAFEMWPPNPREGFAAKCAENDVTKIAELTIDFGWAQAERTGFTEVYPDYDLERVYDETYPADVSDLSSFMLKAQESGAEAIVSHNYPRQVPAMIRGINEISWEPKIISHLGLDASKYEKVGEVDGIQLAEGGMGTAFYGKHFPFDGNDTFQTYWQESPSRPSGMEIPNSHAAQAWGGVQVLAKAMDVLGSDFKDPDAVRDWLLNEKVECISGQSNFDADGVQQGINQPAIQHQEGNVEFVWPDNLLTTDNFIFPKPWP